MILGFTWLDLVLAVVLVVFLLQGRRRGLWVVLGELLGLVVGTAAAFLAIPLVSERVPDPFWRAAAIAVVVAVLLGVGHAIGMRIGESIRLHIGLPALRRVDRWLGAVAAVVVAAMLMGLISFSLSTLGSTPVTREVARSRILTAVDAAMPDPVLAWAARARAAVADLDVLPELELPAPTPEDDDGAVRADDGATPSEGGEASASSASATVAAATESSADPSAMSSSAPADAATESGAGPSEASTSDVEAAQASGETPTDAPDTSASSSAPTEEEASPLEAAEAATVRLTGTAEQCDQVQSGTGVAIAPDRVLTNAHVVAGLEAPTVQDQDRGVLEARIVLLDTARDLAVLAVDGADLPVAALGDELTAGASAVAMGYPDGGPFATTDATVDAVGEVPLQDVLSTAVSQVDVYTMAADIRHGYSGGPVVSEEGELVGLVFARAPGDEEIGYALTADSIAGAVAEASSLSETVSAGACVPGT